jgi:hypothetical protein
MTWNVVRASMRDCLSSAAAATAEITERQPVRKQMIVEVRISTYQDQSEP